MDRKPETDSAPMEMEWLEDVRVLNSLRAKFFDARQHQLLDWLERWDAKPEEFLGWLNGDGLTLAQGETPSEAIIQSLPAPNDPFEWKVRRVLIQRTAAVIEWLAHHSDTWMQWSADTWFYLFELAYRIRIAHEHSNSIVKIRCAFDEVLTAPNVAPDLVALTTGSASTFRIPLTLLSISNQPDNSLEERWIGLIKGQSDIILQANVIDAFKGLMSLPAMVDVTPIETSLRAFFTNLEKRVDQSEKRKDRVSKLLQIVETQFGIYTHPARLVIAGSRNEFGWLPEMPAIYSTIVANKDLAAVAQIARKSQNPEEAAIAEFQHRRICRQRKSPIQIPIPITVKKSPFDYKSVSPGNVDRQKLFAMKPVSPKSLNRYLKQFSAATDG